jgi:hypothetical protein
MKFLTSFIFLLSLVSDLTKASEVQISWSEINPSTVKVQIQNCADKVPPELSAYSLQDPSAKPIQVPQFKAMSVEGFWETGEWNTSNIQTGVYILAIKLPDSKKSLLDSPGNFQTIQAEILHNEAKISWIQTTPGAVRVLVQGASGLAIGAPSGWMICGMGKQSVSWDGKGADGVDYSFQPNITAVVQVAEFHKDLLVIGETTTQNFIESTKSVMSSLGLPPGKNLKINCKAISAKGKALPACEAGGALSVQLPPETMQALLGKRFEILVYVDGTFVQEESQGVNPYLYRIPNDVSAGAKTISINIMDYQGGWGVATLPFKQVK